MLYGRATEEGQLRSLLLRAAEGTSGALVVHGEAGIGKTALLEHLAADAGAARVLRTTGIESETELPFAALHQLLRPALDRLGVLPEPQADALRAAFGLAAPTGQDRFLTGLGVLTLLSEYAGEDPVLCLVDDAQWVDRESLDALTFAARRLDSEGVVMVFAVREPIPLGLPELRLDALDRAPAAVLLTEHAGTHLPPHVRERVAAEARGNPLALIELPRALSAEQRAGLLGPLPATPGDPTPSSRVTAAFGARIGLLPDETRSALLVAAADDTGDLGVVLAAAQVSPAALEPAETAGLIRLDGTVLTFRHPLVRAAACRSATLARRIGAHLALADVLVGEEHADRRAWHRAAAATGPDEEVARELDRAAERASGRQGMASASAAHERAAQLSPDPAERRRRLVAAAQAAADAGQFQRVEALLRRGGPSGAGGGGAPDSGDGERGSFAGELGSGDGVQGRTGPGAGRTGTQRRLRGPRGRGPRGGGGRRTRDPDRGVPRRPVGGRSGPRRARPRPGAGPTAGPPRHPRRPGGRLRRRAGRAGAVRGDGA
ncbi:AAA family ATPase [Kitasatospora aburaviensis]